MAYLTARNSGWLIGKAIEEGQIKKAETIFLEAVQQRTRIRTLRDYQVPLQEHCTMTRIVTLWSEAGIETVEDFYRAHPRDLAQAAESSFSSKLDVEDQSRIVENKFTPRLHGRVLPAAVRKLLDADILCVYDVCYTRPEKLRAILPEPRELQALVKIQRQYR